MRRATNSFARCGRWRAANRCSSRRSPRACSIASPARGLSRPKEILTERELDVLRLLAKGSANKQIGVQLHISESTVKTHVANIFQKLEVTDRTEAVTVALSRGLIKL